jgi:hypothetical protein
MLNKNLPSFILKIDVIMRGVCVFCVRKTLMHAYDFYSYFMMCDSYEYCLFLTLLFSNARMYGGVPSSTLCV